MDAKMDAKKGGMDATDHHGIDRESKTLDVNHPWRGFAHPDHQSDDLYRLLRMFRSTITNLHVFHAETQMVPFFRTGLKGTSVEDLEQIFKWLAENATWKDSLTNPELVPLLSDSQTRKLLQEFARNALCVRELQQELKSKIRNSTTEEIPLKRLVALLGEAERTSEQLLITSLKSPDLQKEIDTATGRLERFSRVERFFNRMTRELGAPAIVRCEQGPRFVRALECIQRIPTALRPWRYEHILDPAQRLRLQTWKVKARPILELRKELTTHFNFDTPIAIETLQEMASIFKEDGWFVRFKAPYRQNLKTYRSMLRDQAARKRDRKESDFQRAERLLSWVSYYEQAAAFEDNQDAQSAFAPNFQGIDTDFTSAIDASAWAQKIQEEILVTEEDFKDSEFNMELLNFVRFVREDKISSVVQILGSDDLQENMELLKEVRMAGQPFFTAAREQAETRLKGLQRLEAITQAVGFAEEIPLSALQEIRERTEEMSFLVHWMNSHVDLRAKLKGFYAGPSTDLQAMDACSRYVRHVKSARLPDPIMNMLLSARGPHHLSDSRPHMERCMRALAIVKDDYAKLEAATHGQILQLARGESLETLSVEYIMERIQGAVRQPQHFVEAVNQLKHLRMLEGLESEGPLGLKVEMDEPALGAHSKSETDQGAPQQS